MICEKIKTDKVPRNLSAIATVRSVYTPSIPCIYTKEAGKVIHWHATFKV